MKIKKLTVALAALMASGMGAAIAQPGGRPAAAHERAVHAIVYIDLIPSEKTAGSVLLAGYARRARRDAALQSATLIKQASIPNHFILDEAFASEAAYQRFTRQAYVRSFRTALYPHLGSPWDERLGVAVSL